MQRIILAAVVGLGGLAVLFGQTSATDEDKAIESAADSYTAAFNKGDLGAFLAHFAADADYVDQGGKQHKGRAELAELFKGALVDGKGQQLKTAISSIRFLRPDVAIADGKAELTAPDGSTDSGRFTAVWIKTAGKWLLSSVHDLPERSATAETSSAPLQQLAWLVGDWSHKDPRFSVQVRGRWALARSFLVLEYTVKGKDNEDLTVVQYFGRDPLAGVIHAWFFDSKGGYGGGDWVREGNTWTANWSGVLADGRVASSTSSLKYLDDNNFLFRSVDREIGGLPMEDVEARFVRKAEATKGGAP
jgi:uncharacterized protein (TIGR02246 family)